MKTLGELKARLKNAKLITDYYECLSAQQKKEVDKISDAYERTEFDGP